MKPWITANDLITQGLSEKESQTLSDTINRLCQTQPSPEACWQTVCDSQLLISQPFSLHLWLFSQFFPDWQSHPHKAPVWHPNATTREKTNLYQYLNERSIDNLTALQRWSHQHFQQYWSDVLKKLDIRFFKQPTQLVDLSQGILHPNWLPGAKINIATSCFSTEENAIAIICQEPTGERQQLCYAELNKLSNQIANSLVKRGYRAGDVLAIIMPMNIHAVAIYLGIIKMGGIVVSVPDSFSADEITARLSLVDTKAIFTQDEIIWAGKKINLLEKIHAVNQQAANQYEILIYTAKTTLPPASESKECYWQQFLDRDDSFTCVPCDPMTPTHILFSSGTTSTPKAIPWDHTTPIKTGADAYFHQNIQSGDILTWPTSLGWMMGPWLIYAALLNKATLALFPDAPKDAVFGKFVEEVGVTLLGVVPTLVAAWRKSRCMEGLNWSKIKCFSSTGECSNPEDMFYLMWLANFKPIIEYCGGTEIGGAYITSTLLEPNYPSVLTTPALGSAFVLLNENGNESNLGEVALLPPSIGYSTRLLNNDHAQIYYQNMPKSREGALLRRHGDQIKQLGERAYCMLGRVDDSMNLGGIKVSAAEIERAIQGVAGISEVAAIAVSPPHNGPHQLVIFATTPEFEAITKADALMLMQKRLNAALNPLFKISDVILVTSLPKTASNKIMRRILRQQYEQKLYNL